MTHSERHLPFFVVDCRDAREKSVGKFGASWDVDPKILHAPARMREIIKALEAIRGKSHICIMGVGSDPLLDELSPSDGAKLLLSDRRSTLACAEAFTEAGYPYVSIIHGDFAHALKCCADATPPQSS